MTSHESARLVVSTLTATQELLCGGAAVCCAVGFESEECHPIRSKNLSHTKGRWNFVALRY